MLNPILTSQPVQYMTLDQLRAYDNGVLTNLISLSNLYLTTPPRLYAEELNNLYGLYCKDGFVNLLADTNMELWPYFWTWKHQFDQASGTYEQRVSVQAGGAVPVIVAFQNFRGVTIGSSGSLYSYWTNNSLDLHFYIGSYADDGSQLPGVNPIWADTFFEGKDHQGFLCPLIDDLGQRLVDSMDASGTNPVVGVWNLNDGSLIYKCALPAPPVAMCPAGNKMGYILCANSVLILYDFNADEILGAVKVPVAASGSPTLNYGSVVMGYDQTYGRLYIFNKVAPATDGSDLSTYVAYAFYPQPTHITTPIPLEAPKDNSTIPVLTAVVGDLNEGISSGFLDVVVTGPAQLEGLTATDGYGKCMLELDCENPGLVSVDVSLQDNSSSGGGGGGGGTGGGNTAILSGLVKNSSGGAISGAVVSFSGGSAVTNTSGAYTITGVASGTYTVTVTATGYDDASQSVTIQAGITNTVNFTMNTGTSSGGSWTEVAEIQQQTNWVQAGNTGNSGGGSSKPHGTYTITHNGDGSATFAIVPASSYDNYYWYYAIPNKPRTAPQRFRYHIEITVPSGNLSKSQGIEFELQFSDTRFTYNMAWQYDVGGGVWRYFHFVGHPGGAWIATSITDPIVEGTVMVVDAYFTIDHVNGITTHDSLVLNGVTHTLGISQAAVAMGQSNYLHAAFQLDSLNTYPAYQVKINNANVYWLP